MGISKVEYDNETLIDISDDTIKEEYLFAGETAHNSNGDQITGTFPIGEVDTQSVLISQIKSALAGKTAGGGSSSAKEEQEVNFPTITENGSYEILPDSGKVMSKVNVEVAVPEPNLGILEVNGNGIFEASGDIDGYYKVIVEGVIENETVAPGFGSGGSGSGIIDVTELPTSGIDENAVYRLTESVQTNINEIYTVDENGLVATIQEGLWSLGVSVVPIVHIEDELPANLEPTDLVEFSQMHLYVVRTNGIVYMYSPHYGGTITLGILLRSDVSFDKGETKNVYAVTEVGVYTTFETFKDVSRYFIRENGSWVEFGLPCASETLQGGVNVLYEEHFRKKDGTYIASIKNGAFIGDTELKAIHFPEGIVSIGISSFDSCSKLTHFKIPASISTLEPNAFGYCGCVSVTFKGKPNSISNNCFIGCNNLVVINVPWSEGEVANAPWGASNATINYNYTEG